MSSGLHRRDFLKLAGLLPLSLAAPRWPRGLSGVGGQQNVIVVVFDAFSAYNISLYGYERETTPNLARLAKRAIVYHNHYAGSNFTTSGTASLLTGTLPWTHRAISKNGRVAESFIARTVFDVFHDYYRIAYTHNAWAFTLLNQFRNEINELVDRQKLLLQFYDSFINSLFRNDDDIASVSWTRDTRLQDGYAYSLFLSHLHGMLQNRQISQLQLAFPRGLPSSGYDGGFLLEEAIDWIGNVLTLISQPFLGYFHFLPPHSPYNPPLQYVDRFKNDGYRPIEKPVDIFAGNVVAKSLLKHRTEYDQFILYADQEFGRFYDQLEKSGLLENTWLILTSDHGEMFERGIMGHSSETLYQPVMRIPLLIFEPGRNASLDISTPTSAVDVLPTLAQITGHTIPSWVEGTILPPYSNTPPDPGRSLYAARATRNDIHSPLTEASTMLLRGRYKLLHYFGYADLGIPDIVRLYDVEADPEEMTDLSSSEKEVAADLLKELKSRVADANKAYL